MNISEMEILSKEESTAILLEEYEKNFTEEVPTEEIHEYIWHDNI